MNADTGASNTLPVPPPELADYVAAQSAGDAVENYQQQGLRIHAAITSLPPSDWTWNEKKALDFGCGSGRVLRHFLTSPTELHGCDIDEACVAWVQDNLAPKVSAHVSAALPPLSYADETFDVIWTTSVFSHLTDSWADWLLELRRILKPGGRLIASVMGERSSQAIAGEPWDPGRIGMTVLGYARPWAAGGPMVLHSEWWLRAHWGRAFDIEAIVPGGIEGQDAVVLRRPAQNAPTAAELRAPDVAEPRELAAALHTIELLHREHAVLNEAHDAYAAAYAAESRRTETLLTERDALAGQLAAMQHVDAAPDVGRRRRSLRSPLSG